MTALRRYCDVVFNFHTGHAGRAALWRVEARAPIRSAALSPPLGMLQGKAFPDHNGTIPERADA
jgi:hypothetical protein